MALGRKTGGRQTGSLNRATAEVRALASEYGEAAIEELARLASEAQSETARIAAIALLLKRGFGDSNSVPVQITLPDTKSPEGIVAGVAAIVGAVSSGELTPEAGRDLAMLLETQRKAIELNDLDQRLRRLEDEAQRKMA